MSQMKDIFYSGTFAGETALNACEATIDFLKIIIQFLKHKKGNFLKKKINSIINQNNLENILSLTGHETWLFLNVKKIKNINPELVKAYIRQELIKIKFYFLVHLTLPISIPTKIYYIQ